MGTFDLDRAARLLARALLAVFVIDLLAEAIQLFSGDGGFGFGLPTKMGGVYAAATVSPSLVVLLLVGLVVLAVRPHPGLLTGYMIVGWVSVAIAVVGFALLLDMNEPYRSIQGWRLAGSLIGGGVLAAVVATLAARVRAGATGTEGVAEE